MTMLEVVEKLIKRFGHGQDRERRAKLYRRIGYAVERNGEEAERLVAVVASEAKVARQPDRYFCYVCLRRLEERGFIEPEEL